MPSAPSVTVTASPARKRSGATRLSREDWLEAAFSAVVEGGFDQARVLVLADRLGVTRGSFYWHFADHAALIRALLERWQAQENAANARLMTLESADPAGDLEQLLEAALAHAGTDLENMRFELALRGLGRRDAEVAALLAQVDRQRMSLFEHKFLRLTGDPQTAGDLAALFYLAIVGSYQALSRPNSPASTKAYLMGVISRYVIARAPAASAPSPS
jgi:AcrR family transcriptional regulator